MKLQKLDSLPLSQMHDQSEKPVQLNVKTCFRSRMKDDLLNSLLMITINGPAFKTAEYENLLEEVTNI